MTNLKKYFLAFDIGCIECGEESKPLGLFATETEADKVAEAAQKKHWKGQHDFEVYEIEVPV
jgi:hypothetical protein